MRFDRFRDRLAARFYEGPPSFSLSSTLFLIDTLERAPRQAQNVNDISLTLYPAIWSHSVSME